MNSFSNFYGTITRLRHIDRFPRHAKFFPQSVAEHSMLVAMVADDLTGRVQEAGGQHWRFDVCRGDVVRAALWHDATECYISDIPHDIKAMLAKHGGGPALDAIELEATARLENLLSRGNSPYSPFLLQQDQRIRLLVKMADWYELLGYVMIEESYGNTDLQIAKVRIWDALEGTLRSVVKEIVARYNDGATIMWYDQLLETMSQELKR